MNEGGVSHQTTPGPSTKGDIPPEVKKPKCPSRTHLEKVM